MPEPIDNIDILFHPCGPVAPIVIDEAVRVLMQGLPINVGDEPRGWSDRRAYCALRSFAALQPRDEIEVMLAVHIVIAHYAAAAVWRIGMNGSAPHGESTRHLTTAAGTVRLFDTVLRTLERRQTRTGQPVEMPEPRDWTAVDPSAFMRAIEARALGGVEAYEPEETAATVWSPADLATADTLREQQERANETAGLDIANTEGILPGGGMIMPAHPTPQQIAYINRRLERLYRREYEENRRRGIDELPHIHPLRTGDFVP